MDLRRGWMTEHVSVVRMSEEDPARAMAAGHGDKNRGELDRGRAREAAEVGAEKAWPSGGRGDGALDCWSSKRRRAMWDCGTGHCPIFLTYHTDEPIFLTDEEVLDFFFYLPQFFNHHVLKPYY
jgi:hypothetical protein